MSEYINADCMDYLPGYADDEFDLAIVDPPYGGGWSSNADDVFRGAIVGRFGGRFASYHLGIKDGRRLGDEVPSERGYL